MIKPGDLVTVLGDSGDRCNLRTVPEEGSGKRGLPGVRVCSGEHVLVVSSVEIPKCHDRDLMVVCRNGIGWIYSTIVKTVD